MRVSKNGGGGGGSNLAVITFPYNRSSSSGMGGRGRGGGIWNAGGRPRRDSSLLPVPALSAPRGDGGGPLTHKPEKWRGIFIPKRKFSWSWRERFFFCGKKIVFAVTLGEPTERRKKSILLQVTFFALFPLDLSSQRSPIQPEASFSLLLPV